MGKSMIFCRKNEFHVLLFSQVLTRHTISYVTDELGRGTSTFDGTAIASATVKHLVQRSQCLSLFATHYHSLLEEWKDAPNVRLGHMQCIVNENDDTVASGNSNITFLYTLGPGAVPKSFGINVAKLAGLPDEVLENAKRVSHEFEEEMNEKESISCPRVIQRMSDEEAKEHVERLKRILNSGDSGKLLAFWKQLQEQYK
jgi:DNA mismatch repair protein MSH6